MGGKKPNRVIVHLMDGALHDVIADQPCKVLVVFNRSDIEGDPDIPAISREAMHFADPTGMDRVWSLLK